VATEPEQVEWSGGNSLPPDPLFFREELRFMRGKRILRILLSFFLGQGATQGISVLAALFLVHRLSVNAYAQFSLAMGFQTVFVTLMDLGFASTIVPLVGQRKTDRTIVGKYVRSAKHWRNRTFWILSPAAIASFLIVVHRQQWSWNLQFLLLGSVLLALYSAGKVSYYAAPLILHGRLRDYYLPQVVTGVGRLLSYIALEFTTGLSAPLAAGIGAINVSLNGVWLARKSKPLFDWPEQNDPTTNKELMQYILPAAPALIFSAFQTQITLFLITIFSGETLYIAQVAALGRIGQLFSILMTFNVVIIEPYIAQKNRQQLLPAFSGLVLLAVLLSAPVVVVAFLWPQVFLWLIGSKYENLGSVMGWVILSACMNYVASLIWVMNRARKWVFWSGSALEVGLLIAAQLAYVVLVGVRTTSQAVMLGVAASFCYIIAHSYVAIYGFIKGAPKTTDDVRLTSS
jgi:O-antigen/teichoic acid export membrane protein